MKQGLMIIKAQYGRYDHHNDADKSAHILDSHSAVRLYLDINSLEDL